MVYREFKQGEERVSLLGFGLMRLPKKVEDKDDIDYAEAEKLVDYAYQNGVNYFDTAYFYHGGDSEAFAGHALSRYPRDSYYLASKMPVSMLEKPEDMERIFTQQLQRCRTEYFDFYLCHALGAGGFEKTQEMGLYKFLVRKKQEGKIRRIGFSFHDTPEVLQRIVDAYQWDFVQLQLNYLDWEHYRSREQYEIAVKSGLPVIVMEPVRGGSLANLGEAANAVLEGVRPGASVASWALRYAAALPGVLCVLSGMSNLAQVEDNIGTFAQFTPPTDEERAALEQALATYRAATLVGCTACRYCMPCPAGVDIPGTFSLYNQVAMQTWGKSFEERYAEWPEETTAKGCIACGACEATCPQKLPIAAMMEKIAAGQTPLA